MIADCTHLRCHWQEPSCCAGLLGPSRLAAGSPEARTLLQTGTHIFWATGGSLVPAEERARFVARGTTAAAEAADLALPNRVSHKRRTG